MSLFKLVKSCVPESVRDMVHRNMSSEFISGTKFALSYGFSSLRELRDPHVFIHLPKCGGNSIAEYLSSNDLPTLILDHCVAHPKYKFPHELSKKNNPKAFCVSRNPFDRLGSAYFFLSDGGVVRDDEVTFEKYLSRYDSFQDFVLRGLGNEKTGADITRLTHMIPQTEFVVDGDGDLCFAKENLVKFENLGPDFANYVRSRGHVSGKLPWENKTKSGRNYFDEYRNGDGSLNRDMVDIVAETYDSDFERFGYSKDFL